jgi:hypothetical protein
MNAYVYLIKAAKQHAGIAIEQALLAEQKQNENAIKQLKQYARLKELGSMASSSPVLQAAKTGLIGALMGSIPGVLLGGKGGALAGAGLSGALAGAYGAGRPERALKILEEIHGVKAPLLDTPTTPKMRSIANLFLKENA